MKQLSSKATYICSYDIRKMGSGRATEFLINQIQVGNGELIESLVLDILEKSLFWNVERHEKRSDPYDAIINGKFVEIRRVGTNTNRFSVGPTNGKTSYDESAAAHKFDVLKNGGYIIAQIKGSVIHLYWFPTKELRKHFNSQFRCRGNIKLDHVLMTFGLYPDNKFFAESR